MDFRTIKLSDFAAINMGQSPKSEFYNSVGDGMPFLQGNRTFGRLHPSFDTYTSKPNKVAETNDVIMSVRAPVGDLNIASCTLCLGRGVCSLKAFNGNQSFLFYLMKHYACDLVNRESGTVFGSVNRSDIANLVITVPSRNSDQQKIAAVLSALDSKIELNTKINNNLEQQIHAIFEQTFGDSSVDIQEKTTLGAVCKCVLGGTPSRAKAEFWNGNVPWINSGEVNKFRIIQPSEYITKIGLEKSATKLLPTHTTVIAITGATLGQISLLEISSCANQSVVGILENEDMPYEFIYPFIHRNIGMLLSHQTGGAQQHINKQNVEQLPLELPTKPVLHKYKTRVEGFFKYISKNCFENERLAAIRDALLPKLMSGEIDVSKVDISNPSYLDKLLFSEETE